MFMYINLYYSLVSLKDEVVCYLPIVRRAMDCGEKKRKTFSLKKNFVYLLTEVKLEIF